MPRTPPKTHHGDDQQEIDRSSGVDIDNDALANAVFSKSYKHNTRTLHRCRCCYHDASNTPTMATTKEEEGGIGKVQIIT
eukprot:scaffold20353_cov76-Skeletonema_dohrnii-CCMP3373.AAC.4